MESCILQVLPARAPISADMLATTTPASAEFFHTPAGPAFVDLLVDGHRETWPIRSQRFRTWLRRCHYEEISVLWVPGNPTPENQRAGVKPPCSPLHNHLAGPLSTRGGYSGAGELL